MKHYIAIFSIVLSYYAIGGMATTNIMRLLKGATVKQNNPHCRCDNCGSIIPVYHQFPLFSYVRSRGKCRKCGIEIPVLTTVIEIGVGLGMTAVSAVFLFRPVGVACSFAGYEIFRWCLILKYGKRENNFISEYLWAIFYMFIALILVLFMSLLVTVS